MVMTNTYLTSTDSVNKCAVCDRSVHEGTHVAIIVPIYKSQKHINPLVLRLNALNDEIPGGLRVTFVIDGSPDSSADELDRLASKMTFSSRVVDLSRNFGVSAAVHAGLQHTKACVVVVVGSDLQEPQGLVVRFIEEVCSGSADVVIGSRLSRDDPRLSQMSSAIYWFILRKVMNSDVPPGGFDVFALSPQAQQALSTFRELNSNITSQVQWIGMRRIDVPYHRNQRVEGKSSWTIRKKFKLMLDSIYGFSGFPLVIITFLGTISLAIFSLVALLTGIGVVLDLVQVRGYPTLILIVMIGFSAVISSLGIVGGYLYRTFDNSKGRPLFIVRDEYELS